MDRCCRLLIEFSAFFPCSYAFDSDFFENLMEPDGECVGSPAQTLGDLRECYPLPAMGFFVVDNWIAVANTCKDMVVLVLDQLVRYGFTVEQGGDFFKAA